MASAVVLSRLEVARRSNVTSVVLIWREMAACSRAVRDPEQPSVADDPPPFFELLLVNLAPGEPLFQDVERSLARRRWR